MLTTKNFKMLTQKSLKMLTQQSLNMLTQKSLKMLTQKSLKMLTQKSLKMLTQKHLKMVTQKNLMTIMMMRMMMKFPTVLSCCWWRLQRMEKISSFCQTSCSHHHCKMTARHIRVSSIQYQQNSLLSKVCIISVCSINKPYTYILVTLVLVNLFIRLLFIL